MNILDNFDKLINTSNMITKDDLLSILKKYAKEISVYDLMNVYNYILDDMKYVQINYQENAINAYVNGFINRVNEIKKDNNNYEKVIDKKQFNNALLLFKSLYKNKTLKTTEIIYILTSIYATYIIEEPIHHVGTIFPGSLKIIKKENNYYCPVKNANLKTPNAVCRICIAKQLIY